jgi:mannose-6-phosphate isomerase-like protein (cupin superfamily)
MACMTLIGGDVLPFLGFVHRCRITAPQGGVGHHVHLRNEEMFFIFDGEAEFTVDGHTSLLAGPVGVPLRLGQSHAILNPTDRPVEFMNVNVATVDGQYDARDLDDSRVGVAKEPVPAFTVMRIDAALLEPRASYRGGRGTVRYRRALDATVFRSSWSYVDHLVIPPGASEGFHRHSKLGEVYYVVGGAGEVTVDRETSALHEGDAVPILAGEAHSLANTGSRDFELIVFGIALDMESRIPPASALRSD